MVSEEVDKGVNSLGYARESVYYYKNKKISLPCDTLMSASKSESGEARAGKGKRGSECESSTCVGH